MTWRDYVYCVVMGWLVLVLLFLLVVAVHVAMRWEVHPDAMLVGAIIGTVYCVLRWSYLDARKRKNLEQERS